MCFAIREHKAVDVFLTKMVTITSCSSRKEKQDDSYDQT
jgi:hypothetical protein